MNTDNGRFGHLDARSLFATDVGEAAYMAALNNLREPGLAGTKIDFNEITVTVIGADIRGACEQWVRDYEARHPPLPRKAPMPGDRALGPTPQEILADTLPRWEARLARASGKGSAR